MDELDQILQSIPPEKREAIRAYWVAETQRGVDPTVLASSIRAKYPAAASQVAVPSSEVRRPNLPAMAPESTVGAETPGPKIPLANLPQPGPLQSAGNAFASTVVPFFDETAAALRTGHTTGPEYETARRAVEYQLGRGAARYPEATTAGQLGGAVGGMFLLPGVSAEKMAAQGPGRALLRNVAEGAGIGAVYGSGASDPGNRLSGGILGGTVGTVAGLTSGVAGELLGSRMGTAGGRRVRDLAEAGDTPIANSRQLLNQASPDAPLTVADVIGPVGTSRIRAAAVIPGQGQRTVQSTYAPRAAGRSQRVQGVIEDATGAAGINPYQAAEDLRRARSEEANRLYEMAYQASPSKEAQAVSRVPRIAEAIRRLRQERAVSGLEVARGKATVEELHSVRKLLDSQARALENPSLPSADRERAYFAAGLRDRLDAALKTSPEFARADEAFRNASGLMEGFEQGRTILQTDPALVEFNVGQATPDERRMMLLGLPSSTARALESGTARGALSRLGLGQAPRGGRQRILDAILDPQTERRLDQMVLDEEMMLPAEHAASASSLGSMTEPNRQSVLESYATGGLGALRNRLVRSFRSPDVEGLAADADVLTASGGRMRDLLGQAETATRQRGETRKGFNLGGRIASAFLPSSSRTGVVADRAVDQEEFDRLVASGLTEEEAMRRLRP